ncbi:MAG: ion transporter [Opitutales bacterium]
MKSPSALARTLRDDRRFELFVLAVIVIAGINVGLETSPTLVERFGGLLRAIDAVVLGIFTLEAAIKILAEGRKPWRYFQSGWNLFDFTIVVVCYLPVEGEYAAVLRLARVLRVLRLITTLPRLRILAGALLRSLPSMFYVTLLLLILFYAYAVLGVYLFRGNDPGHFGDLGTAMLTLFRVVTLEDWTDVMYTAIQGSHVYPAQGAVPMGPEPQAFGFWGALYFVSFVVFGALVMINLFIGVILTSITEVQGENLRQTLHVPDMEKREVAMQQSLDRMQAELSSLREALARDKEPPPEP